MKSILIYICIIALSFSTYAQDRKLDSLKSVLTKSKEDSNKIYTLIEVAKILRITDPLEAHEYSIQALALANKLDFLPGIALSYKWAGFYFYDRSQYDSTEYYWKNSLENYKKLGDNDGISNMLNNMGSRHYNEGIYAKALEYFLPALEAGEKTTNKLRVATPTLNIGLVYMEKTGTRQLALEYLEKSRKMGEEIGNAGIIGTSNLNIGEIYMDMGNDSMALKHFMTAKKALEPDGPTLPHLLNDLGKLYQKKGNYAEAEKWLYQALAKAEDNILYRSEIVYYLGQNHYLSGNYTKALEYFNQAKDLATEVKVNTQLKLSYKGLANTYSHFENYKLAYLNENAYSRLSDSLSNFKTDSIQSEFEIGLKEKEIKILTAEKTVAAQELRRQKLVRNAFLVGFALVVTLIGVLYRDYKNKIKTNKLLDQRKAEIETLLLNILPYEVAEELQKTGKSNPRYYESTTVMFTDFVGFSRIAETLTPQQVTAELNEFFTEMDEIIDRYGIEKIKTIGDSYMCAGGIPTPNTTHPLDVVRAGLDIVEFLRKKNKAREEAGLALWEIRIGLNTGSLVAGVVGKKKYAYDIWGSAVNIASRMESNGSPGVLNISASTYELIKDKFECEYRGKIYAKNVGEIDMYFVKRELTNGDLNLEKQSAVSSQQ